MKTELTKVEIISEFTPVIKESKIELSKAESHAVAFAPSMQVYTELAANLKPLDKLNPTETDAKIARENRLKMVKVRTGAEEIKDLRKEGIKAEGDLIQSLYNVVKNSCLVTENEFLEIEKHQERKEAERIEKLASDRAKQLEQFGTDTTYLPLGAMTDEQFTRMLENETLAFNARKEAAEKAELARIEAERIAAEKEAERIRLEAEERERMRVENERLKKEAEEREALAKIEREKAAAEQKRLAEIAEAERKKQQAAIDKANAEAAKAQAALKAEKEAAELAQQKERERIEGEEAERAARAKAALLAPDKDKVNLLYLAIKGIEIPEFSTAEAKALGEQVKQGLQIVLNGIKDLSKTLK